MIESSSSSIPVLQLLLKAQQHSDDERCCGPRRSACGRDGDHGGEVYAWEGRWQGAQQRGERERESAATADCWLRALSVLVSDVMVVSFQSRMEEPFSVVCSFCVFSMAFFPYMLFLLLRAYFLLCGVRSEQPRCPSSSESRSEHAAPPACGPPGVPLHSTPRLCSGAAWARDTEPATALLAFFAVFGRSVLRQVKHCCCIYSVPFRRPCHHVPSLLSYDEVLLLPHARCAATSCD